MASGVAKYSGLVIDADPDALPPIPRNVNPLPPPPPTPTVTELIPSLAGELLGVSPALGATNAVGIPPPNRYY